MEIVLDNNKYELDLTRAQELGVLKKIRQQITSVYPGDVFYRTGKGTIVLIKAIYFDNNNENVYSFVGLNGCLMPYSNYEKLMNYKEILDFLNKEKAECVGNVNTSFKNAINDLVEKHLRVDKDVKKV